MRITNTTSTDIAFPDFRRTGADPVLGRNFFIPANSYVDVDIEDFWPHIFNPEVLSKIADGSLTLTTQAADTTFVNRVKSVMTTLGFSW